MLRSIRKKRHTGHNGRKKLVVSASKNLLLNILQDREREKWIFDYYCCEMIKCGSQVMCVCVCVMLLVVIVVAGFLFLLRTGWSFVWLVYIVRWSVNDDNHFNDDDDRTKRFKLSKSNVWFIYFFQDQFHQKLAMFVCVCVCVEPLNKYK